jgi:type IV secretion system protein VirB8
MADEALDTYFAESTSWDIDRAAQTVRTLRIAWVIAAAGWACAITVAVALMVLMPLKTVEPFVIRVDNTTGIVDVVPIYTGQAEIGETVTRYLLTHYVTECEGFDINTAERDYEECGAFNSPHRNQEWYDAWNPSNPASPLNLYKDGTAIRVQIISITFFKKHNGVSALAQVRYTKSKRPPGGSEVLTHWIATIDYAYVHPSRDPKMRTWNPLGFRVVDFHAEPEVAEATPPAPDTKGSTP